MQKDSVTAKGKYLHSDDPGAVTVDSYVMVKESEEEQDGKAVQERRFLLLKLHNLRDEAFDSLTLKVTQYSAEGALLCSERYRYGNEGWGGNCFFVLNDKIPLRKDCADFRVSVLGVRYGNYRYKRCRGGVCVDYIPRKEENTFDVAQKQRELKGKKLRVTPFRIKVSALICLFAVLLAACVCALGFYGVERYTQTADGFTRDGVEYAFIDGNKGETGTLSVTGSNGKKTSLSIPSEIGGYPVVRVENDAFSGNGRLTSVWFESQVSIGARAFSDCSSLTDVNFDRVVSVGESSFFGCASLQNVESDILRYVGARAFEACSSLRSVHIDDDGELLYLGTNAFSSCGTLDEVNIEKRTFYEEYNNLFFGCNVLRVLRLNNLNDTKENASLEQVALSDLFGGMATELVSLSFRELGAVTAHFCSGFEFLKDVYIESAENSAVGEYAFYGCSDLEELSLPNNISELGMYAFSGTALRTFDARNIATIGEGVFSDCRLLQEVNFSDNTKLGQIGQSAFRGCVSLRSIRLPAGLDEIADYAFEDCSQLTSVQLPEGVRNIGGSAFSGCSSLREMTFPDSTVSIGQGALRGCDSLSRLTTPFVGGSRGMETYLSYMFGGYSYYESRVIPVSLTEISVTDITSLEEGAFYNCSQLTSVKLSEGVTEIGNYALQGCSGLRSLTLPSRLYSIGEYALQGCTQLSDLRLPEQLSRIGQYAFADCISLSELTLPDSLQEAGQGLLNGCYSLSRLTTPFVGGSRGMETYLAYMFGGYSCYESYYIPSSLQEVCVTDITDLGDGAFYNCTRLISAELPEGLTTVGNSAFQGCTQLSSLTLPKGLSDVGQYAFADCYALTELTLPDSLLTVGQGALSNCNSLTRLKTPFVGGSRGMEMYLAYMFGSYSYYDSYMIPSSLTEICVTDISYLSDYAFYNCWQLVSAELPEGLTGIGMSAFQGCSGLSTLALPAKVSYIGDYALQGCMQLSSLTLPEGLSDVGQYAFADCYALTELTLPDSLLTMGRGALNNCNSLSRLTTPFVGAGRDKETYLAYLFGGYSYYESYMISSSLREISVTDIDSISDCAFYNCSQLTSVELPEGVTSIGSNAFAYCSQLSRVDLPSTIAYIFDSAFQGCEQLSSSNFSEKLQYIGNYAFQGCAQLSSADFSEGLNSIGSYAFQGCVSLPSANFPDSLTSIGEYAFEGCSQLSSAVFSEGLTEIGSYAFNGCSSLTELSLPNSLQTAGRGMLGGCTSLDSLTIPFVGSERMGENHLAYLFGGYSYYDNYLVPSSLREICVTDTSFINGYTFYSCAQLVSAEFLEGLTGIGNNAFSFCYKLESISFPSTLTSIGDDAFRDCCHLYEVYNKSELPLSCGSIGYGMAAYYAYAVYAEGETPVRAESDGYGFLNAGDTWYLTGVPEGLTEISFPDSFYYGGQEVKEYEVAHYLLYWSDTPEKIFVPSSVTAVGAYAFAGCASLVSAEFEEDSPVTQISSALFSDCGALSSLTLPAGVQNIQWAAFMNCQNLRVFTVGEDVTEIEQDAFAYCYRLSAVCNESALPITAGSSDYGRVAENAFVVYQKEDGQVQFTEVGGVEYAVWQGQWYAVGCSDDATEVRLESFYFEGELVDDIIVKNNAFRNKYALRTVYIGEAVSQIGSGAFNQCTSLESVLFENTRIRVLEEETFYNCFSLTELVLPANLEEIGSNAFAYCGQLSSVAFPETLQKIGYNAFNGCGLSSLELPSSLLTIDDYAFSNAFFTQLTLPESVQSVGRYAFAYCYNLKAVTLLCESPVIGEYAFLMCSGLQLVNNFSGLDIEAGSAAYGGIAQYALYVNTDPSVLYEVVQSDGFIFLGKNGEWSLVGTEMFGDTTFLPESVSYEGGEISSYTVASGAFANVSLSYFCIPASVSGIESGAFSDIYFLKGVYYGGTQEQWQQICSDGCGLEGTPVLYYTECVHDSAHWTFNYGGYISTDISPCEWRESKPATCTEGGEIQCVCLSCGEVLAVEETEKTAHEPDENGVCIICGAEGVLIDNAEELPEFATIDEEHPFVTGEGGLVPPASLTEGVCSMTLRADEKMYVHILFTLGEDISLLADQEGTQSEYTGDGGAVFLLTEGQLLKLTVQCGEQTAPAALRLIVYPY